MLVVRIQLDHPSYQNLPNDLLIFEQQTATSVFYASDMQYYVETKTYIRKLQVARNEFKYVLWRVRK